MTKRLFFTCPIQALYMQLNFGVGLYFETKNGDVDFNPQEYADNVDLWLSGYNGRTKIYVESESEHIFEPKEGDVVKKDALDQGLFHHVSVNWISKIDRDKGSFYTKNFSANQQWIGNRAGEIIMRDNKQFFQAEVENDK
jgi:hypothetical protein